MLMAVSLLLESWYNRVTYVTHQWPQVGVAQWDWILFNWHQRSADNVSPNTRWLISSQQFHVSTTLHK